MESIFLKRLANPCRYTDMVYRFGRSPSELCLIFNNVLDIVYATHHHRLDAWDQPFLLPDQLHNYAQAVHQRGAPLQNCFGFIDRTIRKIAQPKYLQRVIYNGHKRVHAIKFQSIVLPNGKRVSESYQIWGRLPSKMVYQFFFMVTYHILWECIFKDPSENYH